MGATFGQDEKAQCSSRSTVAAGVWRDRVESMWADASGAIPDRQRDIGPAYVCSSVGPAGSRWDDSGSAQAE